LTGKDIIFERFDGRIRTGIRKAEKNNNISINIGNEKDISELLSLVRKRYRSQGKRYKIMDTYINELLKAP
jgi:transcriptional regulator of heat shock response